MKLEADARMPRVERMLSRNLPCGRKKRKNTDMNAANRMSSGRSRTASFFVSVDPFSAPAVFAPLLRQADMDASALVPAFL